MLSRVADTIYWMARYMERTNGMLRILRTSYISSQEEMLHFSWRSVLNTYSVLHSKEIDDIERDSSKVLEHILLDRNNVSSVINNIIRSRECARAIQDHITKEMWQCLNDYYHVIRNSNMHLQVRAGDPVTVLDDLIEHSFSYNGTVDITMPRGEGFNYLNIGKMLERAFLSADILSIKLQEINYEHKMPMETHLRSLLHSLSGYELYYKIYRGTFTPDNVLQMILYNTNYPHSILYCLQQVSNYFERLNAESLPESYSRLEFLIGKAMNNVKYSNIRAASVDELQRFIYQTRSELAEVANSFNQFYFGNT
jgi:uncharacterized alpha-E superfamily protein